MAYTKEPWCESPSLTRAHPLGHDDQLDGRERPAQVGCRLQCPAQPRGVNLEGGRESRWSCRTPGYGGKRSSGWVRAASHIRGRAQRILCVLVVSGGPSSGCSDQKIIFWRELPYKRGIASRCDVGAPDLEARGRSVRPALETLTEAGGLSGLPSVLPARGSVSLCPGLAWTTHQSLSWRPWRAGGCMGDVPPAAS